MSHQDDKQHPMHNASSQMMIASKQLTLARRARTSTEFDAKAINHCKQATQVDNITWTPAQHDANVNRNAWSCMQHFTTNATAMTLVQRNCSHHTLQEQEHQTNMIKAITTNRSTSNNKRT